VVVVSGPRVPGDRDFFHADIGKIRSDLGLYNNVALPKSLRRA
jgi:hypothetical protein